MAHITRDIIREVHAAPEVGDAEVTAIHRAPAQFLKQPPLAASVNSLLLRLDYCS
jgi:hypothetical protein